MEKKYCFYRKERLLKRLHIQGVLYLEASDNDVIFHTWDDDYKVRMNFQSALDLLHGQPLVRIHRSYAVFLEAIETIGPDTVTIRTMKPKELPLSKKYYQELMYHIIILESMKDCGCDVSNVDSEERMLQWKMERENGNGEEMDGENQDD